MNISIDTQDSFVLIISPHEIEWILYQLNAPVERLPFADTITFTNFQEAFSSLKSRDWILSDSSDKVILDVTIAGLVGVLGFSKTALAMDLFHEQSTNGQTICYFSAEGLIVEQTPTDNEEIALTALRDLDTLRTRIHEHLGLQDQQAPREGVFQCLEGVFADIPYTLAGDGKSAAVMQLVQLGAEERFANDLVSAMASPLQQATLQVVRLDPEHPDGVRIIGKLTLIEGLYGLWMLVSRLEENNPTIEIIPCDAEQAKKSIDELLKALVS